MAYTNEQHREWRGKRTKQIRQIIEQAKDKPCMDCGIKYPHYVMDFDHVRGVKKFNISAAVGQTTSLKNLVDEISKCEAVCANCHRIRTFERKK